ncbi:MAG: heavy metal translocating P-type ATPase, partial [Candidatus Melainabacteria bacterium HGW-Melainabacteria-1]
SQRFIERFGARYSPIVLLIGILVAILPPLFFGTDWTMWIIRATVFIVAAAPCALVISIPITLVASLGTGARNGVLIKGGVYVEELAKVKVIAMDKTGTLTRGEPEVTDVVHFRQNPDRLTNSQQEFLAVAAGIERRSSHPLAQAIVRYVEAQGVQPAELADFRSLTGAGASASLDGHTVYVGSPDLFLSKLGISLEHAWDDINHLQGEGKTVVLLGDEQAPWGMIAIRDNIRPNAQKAIDAMHAAGAEKVVMLTGDNERTAQAIARELGIDEVYADLKPEDKAVKVRELTARYGHVAMVGDGVNDAPALAEATVGVAMGAAGTDVALETADVALMADDLEKLAYALRLAKRNQSVVNQNLVLSAVVISVLIIGAVGGWFTLPVAVLAHEISEFVVIGSGLRMLRS